MAGVREEEFDEGDVWDVLQQDTHPAPGLAAALMSTTPPPRRIIRRDSNNKGKKVVASSSSKDESSVAGVGASRRGKGRSAPVTIPAPVDIPASRRRGGGNRDQEDEEEDDDGEMLPPHEWLARKMERMGVASPPNQGQAGRSKGRELTKVRDAVLPKTAFSER